MSPEPLPLPVAPPAASLLHMQVSSAGKVSVTDTASASDDPDPECGPIQVVTEPQTTWPARVLVHSIGLGGFYYSVAAFEAPTDGVAMRTGAIRVKWSEEKHPRFEPSEEFQKPLNPWEPRQD